jgi:hypothetical protein
LIRAILKGLVQLAAGALFVEKEEKGGDQKKARQCSRAKG